MLNQESRETALHGVASHRFVSDRRRAEISNTDLQYCLQIAFSDVHE